MMVEPKMLNSQKEENSEGEAWSEPKTKKNRKDDRIKNIVELDNGTMVHVFKYLNYCQLAKKNLVSKRFWNVISTNRHRLTRLLVDDISMTPCYGDTSTEIQVFNEDLTPEEYNEWTICNRYLKQIPLDNQISAQGSRRGNSSYHLSANTKDPIFRRNIYHPINENSAFSAFAKVTDEKWPLFEHFIRLLIDPFISIKRIELSSENDVLNALTKAVTKENRLRSKVLTFNANGSIQNFLVWIKDYVSCDAFVFDADQRLNVSECVDEDGNYHSISNSDVYKNYDKQLFDFCVTGAGCASAITINYYDFSRGIGDLMQKFMDIKSADDCQLFQSIESSSALTEGYYAYDLKEKFEEFLVKGDDEFDDNGSDESEDGDVSFDDDGYMKLTFELCNTDIKKKLELKAEIYDNTSYYDSYAYDSRESSFCLTSINSSSALTEGYDAYDLKEKFEEFHSLDHLI
ncbi:hypothetical protein Ddc_17306 [Ditylenchus destructor]|nr:hypothetical protein Ddc_17306 [Ditylenchus destructor]